MLLSPGRNCWSIEPVETTGVLRDARVYYRELHRAAQNAKRYIALAGWQFDSQVELVRGEDRSEAPGGETRLLPFLEGLCAERADLHVYFLAWDFSVLYALEREWMQRWIFDWSTHNRLHFRFDPHPAPGGSHHQKFVIVDGAVGFAGGMDLCTGRWDDSDHRPSHPDRVDLKSPHGPYHDVQAYVTGEAVDRFALLFQTRWMDSGGDRLDLRRREDFPAWKVKDGIVLPARSVALSRTQSAYATEHEPPVAEVRALYVDAIGSADSSIYLENQYFSARAIGAALETRMRAPDRPKLDIVLVLPERPEALKEELAIGLAQSQLLRALRKTAEALGHRFSVFFPEGTYVHSKVLIVDDRFLSLGSANTTNRSLGLDTELNLAWEAEEGAAGAELRRAIRRVRVTLLAEHAGIHGARALRELWRQTGLATRLTELTRNKAQRLRLHTLETPLESNPLVQTLSLEVLSVDPGAEDDLFEEHSAAANSLFARGVRLLNEWLAGTPAPASAAPPSRG